ncbi:hypothetical protein BS50DRAFT_450535, partial [Corynespora cassiicola Philippines]
FLVGNILGSVIGVRGRAELSLRLARLCTMNLVVLFLGGRTNFFLDKVFQISMTEHRSVHRWVGRMSVAEGILHGILDVLQRRSNMRKEDISVSISSGCVFTILIFAQLFILSGVIAFFSLLFVRRRIYEIFLTSHLPATIALMVFVLVHLKKKSTYVICCISTAAGLLLLQKILWFINLVYRNFGSGPPCRASIVKFDQPQGSEEVVQVRVKLKRPWTMSPGQFVYLCLPGLRSMGLGFLEAHPFMVAWYYDDEKSATTTIVLLVRCFRGFTRKLQLASSNSYAIVDGPYGKNTLRKLSQYDKVLFLAHGIGIAAHLLPIRQLLLAHDEKTARVRRLSFVWLLETKGTKSL